MALRATLLLRGQGHRHPLPIGMEQVWLPMVEGTERMSMIIEKMCSKQVTIQTIILLLAVEMPGLLSWSAIPT